MFHGRLSLLKHQTLHRNLNENYNTLRILISTCSFSVLLLLYLSVSYSSPSLKFADLHHAWFEKPKASGGPQRNQTPLGTSEGTKGSSVNPTYTALVLIYPKSDQLIKGFSTNYLAWNWFGNRVQDCVPLTNIS